MFPSGVKPLNLYTRGIIAKRELRSKAPIIERIFWCHSIWTYTTWWTWNDKQYMFLDLMVTRYFDMIKIIFEKNILQRISEYDMYVCVRPQQTHNAVSNLFSIIIVNIGTQKCWRILIRWSMWHSRPLYIYISFCFSIFVI